MANHPNNLAGLATFYAQIEKGFNHGMNNHHFQLPQPNNLSITPLNGGQPMPGPSSQPPACQMKCPECHQTFSDVISLYSHSAHTHYWNIMASLFMSDFLLINGKCAVCPKSSKLKSETLLSRSVNTYIKHIGGKHRLINKFMPQEILGEYSKLPTTREEYQDAQALLEMADQPERNLMKRVREKEREVTKRMSAKQINAIKSEIISSPYGEGGYPHLPLPPNFHPDGMHASHFLAMGLSFNDHQGMGDNDMRRLTKKGRLRKMNPHEPIKCPECDNMFDNASSLYTHSAQKHYYGQLVELFKTNFMRVNGMCTVCPNRPINDAQGYVLHMGAKHKIIHQFISPEMLLEYEKLPPKKTNSCYTTSKNQSLINCVICGINAKRKFGNITEYKQHLSIFHFRTQIFAAYLPNFPNASTELMCSLCDSQNENRGRNFKSQYALIVHLGSKHNVIMDFADEALSAQLQQYSVYKN